MAEFGQWFDRTKWDLKGEYYSRHITYCEGEKIFEPTLRAKDYLCGPGTSCCMNMRVTEVMALDEGILVKPSCM